MKLTDSSCYDGTSPVKLWLTFSAIFLPWGHIEMGISDVGCFNVKIIQGKNQENNSHLLVVENIGKNDRRC